MGRRDAGRAVAPPAPDLRLGRDVCSDFDLATDREWLVTNGLGGYAAGTVSDALGRRYHGLLVAALEPPLGRRLLVAKAQARARYRDRDHALTSNEYGDGTIHPEGHRHLVSFAVVGGVPTSSYAFDDARLTRRVWMAQGRNATYVSYQLEEAAGPVELRLTPLCADRDFHAHQHGGAAPAVAARERDVEVSFRHGGPVVRLACPEGRFEPGGAWHWDFHHRAEAARGFDAREDLYAPGEFVVTLAPGSTATLVVSCGDESPPPAAEAHTADQARRQALMAPLAREPAWVRQLALAADQFIVARARPTPSGSSPSPSSGPLSDPGCSVIAGYPWFGDWGRDSLIALPGLALATGRPEIARDVLLTWAAWLDQGMLPNRFPDDGSPPEYTSVDAALWIFDAADACLGAADDGELAPRLYPALVNVVDWCLRGTRHGIGVDPADGLLRTDPAPGLALTWMDARVDGVPVTPRAGKPVEVNALWYRALRVLAALAARLGLEPAARRYEALAARAGESFRRRFWSAERGWLCDVVDGPGGDDASLRPNQILAVSLDPTLLGDDEARAVVAAVGGALLTPVGLRSLAPGEPGYVSRYAGGPASRDGAYHQGTVWSWLLGPYALAHFRVHGDRARARAWLRGLVGHLLEGCVGTIGEIFDGDPPHGPRGCPAQAWAVAETLRAWRRLGEDG